MKTFLAGLGRLAIGMGGMAYVAIIYVIVIRALLPDHPTTLQQINAGVMIYMSIIVALVSNCIMLAVLLVQKAIRVWAIRRINHD